MSTYHVMKHGKGWAIRKDGAKRALRVFQNKSKALRFTGYMLKCVIFVHGENGLVERTITKE